MTTLAASKPGADVKQIRPLSDKIAEALEKGLKFPWLGVRQDLLIHKGAPTSSGTATYIVEDPVRGTYFEIEEIDAIFLKFLITEDSVQAAVNKLLKSTSLRPSIEDIIAFLHMLQVNRLAVAPEEALGPLKEMAKPKPLSPRMMLMKVLFFRIPLVRPDAFLSALLPWVEPFWSKPFRYLYAVMGMVGLISALQQIELYFHSATHIFTAAGMVYFLGSVYVLKLLHELGHAFASKQQGVYVRRMGIYMMFFTPMLFTDTTDAWKIPTRRGRLMIGLAGVMVEFYIACISIFFWAMLPDGLLRSVFFYMSGASLASTIMMNLNPFMRFDGYYILMDYLRTSNLRQRSMKMAKYYARRLLVDWQGEIPEEHPRYRFMVAFGIFCNLYILMVMISINIGIYYKVSKWVGVYGILQGFLLFFGAAILAELAYLIKNYKYWGSRRRIYGELAIVALIAAWLFVPSPKTEVLPGLFLVKDVAELEAVKSGKIVTDLPEIGSKVQKGDLLLKLHDFALDKELTRLRYNLAQAQESLRHLSSRGAEGAYREWLVAEKFRMESEYTKTLETVRQLEIKSPIDGVVVDVNKTLRKEAYVERNSYLFTVSGGRENEVKAYAGESVYSRLQQTGLTGGRVLFQDLENSPRRIELRTMDTFPAEVFPNKALFDYAGGPVMTVQAPGGSPKPKNVLFTLTFDVLGESLVPVVHGSPCEVEAQSDALAPAERTALWVMGFLAAEGLI